MNKTGKSLLGLKVQAKDHMQKKVIYFQTFQAASYN